MAEKESQEKDRSWHMEITWISDFRVHKLLLRPEPHDKFFLCQKIIERPLHRHIMYSF